MQLWNTKDPDLRISDSLGSKIIPISKRNTYENKTLLPIHKSDEHEVYNRGTLHTKATRLKISEAMKEYWKRRKEGRREIEQLEQW